MEDEFKKFVQYEFKKEAAQAEKKADLIQLPEDDAIYEKMYERLKKASIARSPANPKL